MKRLKIEDISNAPSLPEKEIEIEEWDWSVIVTGLTKADSVQINELSTIDQTLKKLINSDGPSFLEVKIKNGTLDNLNRIKDLQEIKKNIMN